MVVRSLGRNDADPTVGGRFLASALLLLPSRTPDTGTGMNPSYDAAFEAYKNGNFLPLIGLLREKLKNDSGLCDFVVGIIHGEVKLKRGRKAGKNERRDRQLAARMEERMRTQPYWDALQDVVDETKLSEETIKRAYRKYATRRKSRPCS